MDYHDVGRGRGGTLAALSRVSARTLVAAISSDGLYPPAQQIDLHAQYGGVVPEIASRAHLDMLNPIVARAIVERQTEFLAQGEEHMRPMILKDIASAIEMHESTISRVTSGKYMHTSRGVFELRYFFSSQVEGDDGQGTSSTAIRAKIRKLIRDEDPAQPLSDNRLAEMLSNEGIPVARRTVAKYRESLGIASSADRKRGGTR